MKVEHQVQSFIIQHGLLEPGAKVLVALSGGADSVALLRILLRLGYGCYAVHCNFHLRGEESNRDEAFVADLCRSLGVSFESMIVFVRDFQNITEVVNCASMLMVNLSKN